MTISGQSTLDTYTITISLREYNILKEASKFLSILESLGVDNWEGYGNAQELFNDEED